jgi:paraquat-inducible protein B
MPDPDQAVSHVPESRNVTGKRTRVSFVWIVPIVAALAGVWVAVTRILAEGPKITIVFRSGEGLEAGKTKVRYKGVDVGTLSTLRLSDDHQRVVGTAQLAPKTEGFLVEDTKFWVVRPRISGGTVSGLGTLISGAYIGMDIGRSREKKREFEVLATPPVVTGDVPGRFFVLKTPTLGSLDYGTPLFFRRLQVGEVTSYELDRDGEVLTVQVFVKAPYDQYVTPNTRFWHASGIDVSLTASGVSVQTESLVSILIGGVAFETPPTAAPLPAAASDTVFTLYGDRKEAYQLPARDPQTFRLVFKQSVRGLAAGAPVEFRGVPIGRVTALDAQVDARTFEFSVPVTVVLDATRFGVQVADGAPGADLASLRRKLIDTFVGHGARAQLRSGNLLTGAMYVAIDFFPDAPPATVDWTRKPVELPTVPGELEGIEASLTKIVKKLDTVPIQAIGADLKKALVHLDDTLVSARGTFDNATHLVAPDSTLDTELSTTLQELSRAARSLRVLADYLERHPEALVRGKPGEAK